MLIRNCRLRVNFSVRTLIQETQLYTCDFIVLLFILEGKNKKEEIISMSNYFRITLDFLQQKIKDYWEL